jgi:DNA-binding response OmpR family regulator
MRILVVDDEEHLRRMMRLTLEASGYEVADAADGEEGLKLFGDGLRFDATLLDQRMPGMDGLETLRRMKRQRADACIIMVTAYATIELAVDAMKLGATDFVRKPMTPDTLRHAVAAALAKRDRPSASRETGELPPASAAPSPARPQLPPVEIWTTNGFFVARATRQAAAGEPEAAEYHFVVRRGKEGAGADVAVAIDAKVRDRVAREGKRPLGPASAFWRQQAESALVNYLWNEAELPQAGRLVISRVTAAMLDAAVDWPED